MGAFLKKSKTNAETYDDYSPKEPEVRITKGMYGKLIYRRILTVLGFAAIAGIVLYLCFAATWVRLVPTLSGVGVVAVKNVTYEGGVLPPGAQVLVDRNETQGTKIQNRLKQAFVPSATAAKVEIIAGPYGELNWAKPNILTVDGQPIGVPFPADSEGKAPIDEKDAYLKDQYVGVCISGDCTPGEAFIFGKDNVYGSILVRTDLG